MLKNHLHLILSREESLSVVILGTFAALSVNSAKNLFPKKEGKEILRLRLRMTQGQGGVIVR